MSAQQQQALARPQQHISTWLRWCCGALTALVLLGVWEAAVDFGNVSPRVMAAPSQIGIALFEARATLLPASAVTGWEGMAGFLISIVLGLAVGIALHLSRLFSAAFYPLLAMAQTIPLITVAPLFVIWFGFEPLGKIILVAIFSTFPIAVQTYRGLQAVPRFYSDVALTCGASTSWTLFHVELRVAAHQILGGVKISAAYVFATAATAEYLGARTGLGIVLQSAFNSFQTPIIFAATVIIIAMTGVLLLILTGIERAWLRTPARQFFAE